MGACEVLLIVLGIAQDAGKPQLGHPEDPAWQDPALMRLATSIALVDTRGDQPRRWIFDATPDVKVQLQRLDEAYPTTAYVGIDGFFLTHAHMGHYTGLMHIGHEAARTKGLPVYAMPRMTQFLETNGPWEQLVDHENITIMTMADQEAVELAPGVDVTPFLVPHRDEYSETVGFIIEGPARSAIFLPDINGWPDFDEYGTRIESLIEEVDVAYLDATFYGDELPNISAFPHPKILESMARFDGLDGDEKKKVRFIHLNHSNPALMPGSEESRAISARGYSVAAEGERHCL
jgi:pyrroloquinoline quinone biosynthesis protein B